MYLMPAKRHMKGKCNYMMVRFPDLEKTRERKVMKLAT